MMPGRRIFGIGSKEWESIRSELGIADRETEKRKIYNVKASELFTSLLRNTYKDEMLGLYKEKPANFDESMLAENSMIAIFAKSMGNEKIVSELSLALSTKAEHVRYSYLDASAYALLLHSIGRKDKAFEVINTIRKDKQDDVWNRGAIIAEPVEYGKINEMLWNIQETVCDCGENKGNVTVFKFDDHTEYIATAYALYGIALVAQGHEKIARGVMAVIDSRLKRNGEGLYVAEKLVDHARTIVDGGWADYATITMALFPKTNVSTPIPDDASRVLHEVRREPDIFLNASIGVLLCMLAGKDVFMQNKKIGGSNA